jgi:DNA-binding NarL/FixJ family response regulator
VTIRVLVADDQDIVRTGLVTLLDAQDGIQVVAQARDGQEAVDLARRLRPDVCLLDIRMPRMDGLAATRLLAGPDVNEPTAVVIITTFDSDENIAAALRAGARGLLLKDAGPDLLAQAVRAAADGDALIAPRITARLLSTLAGGPTASRWSRTVDPLTSREEEVAAAVARGLTNSELATALHLSLSTVKFHLASIMTKTGARSRVEVVIWAYETGRVRQ